jgi:ribonuclease HI
LDRKRWKILKHKQSENFCTKTPSKITLLWVPSHKLAPANETTDEAVKEALDKEIQHNEKYPPQDLIKWMKNKHKEENQKKKKK